MTPEPHDPIAIALAEDIGSGDVTSRYFVDADRTAHARVIAREPAIVAGTATAAEVFHRVDPHLSIRSSTSDGTRISPGDPVIEVTGAAPSILTAERVALNFLQRLSGIATLTRQFVDAVAGSRAKILDTRKTTPGLRTLEKGAVAAGGGTNHRFGLFDMVLVKDNHLAGSDLAELSQRIAKVRRERPDIRIEVEADTLEQVRAFLEMHVDVILLDNMKPEMMREAVQLRGVRAVQFEASGGVTLQTIGEIAATGVDFISIGALTHSAPAIDFSLELTHDAA
ncbi:MAG: carboxylating nicotinate-nucleotide diphosphorylase [Chthoniobacterales bacterium]